MLADDGVEFNTLGKHHIGEGLPLTPVVPYNSGCFLNRYIKMSTSNLLLIIVKWGKTDSFTNTLRSSMTFAWNSCPTSILLLLCGKRSPVQNDISYNHICRSQWFRNALILLVFMANKIPGCILVMCSTMSQTAQSRCYLAQQLATASYTNIMWISRGM